MKHLWEESVDKKTIQYSWNKNGDWQSMTVESEKIAKDIEPESEEEFISEHYWGYTRANDQKTYEYEVTHPRWKIYKILNYNISVDFELVYGNNFKNLNYAAPQSVMLAEGSKIKVEKKRVIKPFSSYCL